MAAPSQAPDTLYPLSSFDVVRTLVEDAKRVEKIVSHISAVTLPAGPRAVAQSRFISLARRRGWSRVTWTDRPTAPVEIVIGYDAYQRVARHIDGNTILIALYILARSSALRATLLASGPELGEGLDPSNIAVRVRGPRNAVACWLTLIHVLQQDETWLTLLRPLIEHATAPPAPPPSEAPPPSAAGGVVDGTEAPPPPPPAPPPNHRPPPKSLTRDFVDNGLGLYEGLLIDVGLVAKDGLDAAPHDHATPIDKPWNFLHFPRSATPTDNIRAPVGTYFALNARPALRYDDILPVAR